ncbi:hypothetical protein [Chitinophaga cymbidii]|uniref:Uncharacterized protein n=1 Tax=Chitinophaga cymbidii TaxID=1096750 RepID=A0A512RQQ5_9BACT|nr:hypothetical protein [Chitinophaga cymbidii]GEP98025.1 hypothetical protein CCY01nite_42850 [Chitinophaga cymbidii]
MEVVRKIRVLKMDKYEPVGIIATICFLDGEPPKIGDIVEYKDDRYKINGVIVSGSSEKIKDNWSNGFYDCNMEKV